MVFYLDRYRREWAGVHQSQPHCFNSLKVKHVNYGLLKDQRARLWWFMHTHKQFYTFMLCASDSSALGAINPNCQMFNGEKLQLMRRESYSYTMTQHIQSYTHTHWHPILCLYVTISPSHLVCFCLSWKGLGVRIAPNAIVHAHSRCFIMFV